MMEKDDLLAAGGSVLEVGRRILVSAARDRITPQAMRDFAFELRHLADRFAIAPEDSRAA